MAYMNIFPDINLTQTEEDIIANFLSDPTIKKYLHKLAYDTAKFAATASPLPNQSPEEFLRTLAKSHGRMEVLETLLSVQEASPSP